jgi:hypothetical protein
VAAAEVRKTLPGPADFLGAVQEEIMEAKMVPLPVVAATVLLLWNGNHEKSLD